MQIEKLCSNLMLLATNILVLTFGRGRLARPPTGVFFKIMSVQESNFKRFVEVGRVVLLQSGPLAGKIAVIVEIIDHNRAIIDGPLTSVPRQAFSYRHLSLTPFRLSKLPRGAGSGCIRRQLEKEGIVAKWENSSWAKKRAAIEKRRSLNDFQRFEVMLAKKARRDAVRKAVAKA